MASIGAEAEVTGQNLYFYFDSKAALLRAVLVRGTHALWLELDAALETAADPAAALGSVVAGYVRLSPDGPGCGWTWSASSDSPGVRGAQREYVAEWVALLRQVRPELSQAEARALVQITLTTASDLPRIWHLAQQPSSNAWLTSIAAAILASAPEG